MKTVAEIDPASASRLGSRIDADALYTTARAASFLDLSPKTLANWRVQRSVTLKLTRLTPPDNGRASSLQAAALSQHRDRFAMASPNKRTVWVFLGVMSRQLVAR